MTSRQATQDRTTLLSSAYAFPPVPTSPREFVAQNLTRRPTFFGCETSANQSTPLVIYLANGGPPHNGEAPLTNTSTLTLEYNTSTVQAMLDQIFTIATQGNPLSLDVATDPEWAACLACAVVDRARERAGATRSGICSSCFSRYCWSGSTLGTQTSSGRRRTMSDSRGHWLLGLAVALGILATI